MSEITSKISEYSDEELCALVADGCRDAEEELVKRYLRPVRMCARPYFLAGGDSEDLIQEAMFGLLKAIREFDPHCEARFRTFAEVCIRNRIRSAVTNSTRSKHAPLNDSVPFESPMLGAGAADPFGKAAVSVGTQGAEAFFTRFVLSGNQQAGGTFYEIRGQRSPADTAEGCR